MNWSVIELRVPYVWTFGRAAEKLGEMTGIQAKDMRFVFCGRQLSMEKAFLDDSCMQKESTIHVVTRRDARK